MLNGDKELLHGQFLAPNGVVRTRIKWENIAVKLNNVPGATVIKSGEQFRLAWLGLKTRARASLRSRAAYRNGTGGGPDADLVGLGKSDLHSRVLNMTGLTAAVGTAWPDPLRIQLRLRMRNLAHPPVPPPEATVVIPNADALLDQFVQGIIPNGGIQPLPQMFDEAVGGEEPADNVREDLAIDVAWESPEAAKNVPDYSEVNTPKCGGGAQWSLCFRRGKIDLGRAGAYASLLKQAGRMMKTSQRVQKPAEVGNTVTVPVPLVDRGKGDARNVVSVITEKTHDGFYRISGHGTLMNLVSRNQFDVSLQTTLQVKNVSEEPHQSAGWRLERLY
ncbi:hypothetical protein FOCC_FOCC013699 [Frankliniella occidentalis]|nr:hypothetical protein FOCC_FOCC013699 [Frankliniella occidentalis]